MRYVAGTPPVSLQPLGLAVAAAFVGGAMASLWLPWLAPWWLAFPALLLGIVLWSGKAHLAGDRVLPPAFLRLSGVLLCGFALAALHAAYSLSLQLPPALEKVETTLIGRIVDLPEHEARRTRFLFKVDSSGSSHPSLQGRLLRLAWYDEDRGKRAQAPQPRLALKAGQRWELPVRLRAPRGLRNPGGFDGEKHALAQRLTATGYVRAPGLARHLSAQGGLIAWREAMSARIEADVPKDSSRFVRALALGDTRVLSDEDWRVLRANGLTHLIAISGFHVGLVAGFFALLARGLWWVWPALARRWPAKLAAASAAVLGALVYAAIAGFALPTLRTVLMIAVVAGAQWVKRPVTGSGAVALAAIAVVLVDPLAVLGAGFWLSFLGVAWLLWCLPQSGRHPLGDFLSAQAVATIALLPVSVVLFGQASLAGPLANLVAVPWWSLVVVPLSLVGLGVETLVEGTGAWFWKAAAWCFDLSWPLFDWLGHAGLAEWWLPEPRWFALPLAILGAFWILLPRGMPAKPLALLLWLPLLWPDRDLPKPGEAELVVIDVGQGLSVLVRTHGHALLYDMGPAVRDGFDAGERAVVPALRALGVHRLDRAVISHGDNDHAGGFESVSQEFAIAEVRAPADLPLDVLVRDCVAGETWTWDGVRFRFLHPPPHFPYLKNESSCVLRVESAHGSALLAGDIGEVVERDLVRQYAAGLQSDVVLVAHHGSAGSSDPAFVAATRPRLALVSTGHGNRFGHPRMDVMKRWTRTGAGFGDTAASGALRVGLRADGIDLETRRGAHPRLWDAARRR